MTVLTLKKSKENTFSPGEHIMRATSSPQRVHSGLEDPVTVLRESQVKIVLIAHIFYLNLLRLGFFLPFDMTEEQ
jgi:hypothetical protein